MENGGLALVIGVGDCGCRTINYHCLNNALENIEFLAINSSGYALSNLDIPVERQLLVEETVLAGLVSGSDTDVDKESAIASIPAIKKFVSKDYKIVFILVGLGGPTEAGLSKIVARLFRNNGCVVLTIVSIPNILEGGERRENSKNGIGFFYECSDAVLMFSSERSDSCHCNASIIEGYESSEFVFKMPIDIIVRMLSSGEYPLIDFDDFKTVIQGRNRLAAVINSTGDGVDRIEKAILKLYDSPYLRNVELKTVSNILLFIESGKENNIRMSDIGIIIDHLQDKFGENTVISWGIGLNKEFSSEIRLSAFLSGEF